MREIRIRLKKARKNGVGGAMVELMEEKPKFSLYRWKRSYWLSRSRWKRSFWLITLYHGNGACGCTSYLKKVPGRKRRKRYLNIHRYIKCLNHEIMHAVLGDVIGDDAYYQWDNIVKTNDRDFRYQGKRYGWKNIVGGFLPDVYCTEE